MNALEGSKTDAKVSNGDVATNATHQQSIDTIGFDYASIDVCFEPVVAAGTNSAVAIALKLQQSDTDGSFADVSGYVGGSDFTIPTPSVTTSTSVVRFNVDMRGKKRYLNVYATPNAASPVVSVARLGKPEESPTAASARPSAPSS